MSNQDGGRKTGPAVIPAQAVEAAVDALIASKLGDHPGINGEEFVEAAQAALEAAAPHMLNTEGEK